MRKIPNSNFQIPNKNRQLVLSDRRESKDVEV